MVSCFGLLGVITSFFFVRYIDRRVIMLIGIGACGLAQLGFAAAWTAAPDTAVAGRALVAFTCLFTFFYVAYGKLVLNQKHPVTMLTYKAPYAWLLGGEYPNNHLRAHVFGLGTALNFLGNWAGVFSAPYFINPASLGWGPRYG